MVCSLSARSMSAVSSEIVCALQVLNNEIVKAMQSSGNDLLRSMFDPAAEVSECEWSVSK